MSGVNPMCAKQRKQNGEEKRIDGPYRHQAERKGIGGGVKRGGVTRGKGLVRCYGTGERTVVGDRRLADEVRC